MGSLVLGVDLGGTKVEGAIFELGPGGPRELARRRVPTLRDEGYEAVLMRVTGFVHELVGQAGLSALPPVGVGMPGGVTRRTGLVKNSNTTCLNGRPFRQDLEAALGVRVRFANDANCFALAEATHGAARAYQGGVVFGVILGTGVGGGWVLRGDVWDGPQGIGGEWGHHALVWPEGRPCYCGKRGCVERYLAGPDLERSFAQKAGRKLPLRDIVALYDGDAIARAVLDDAMSAFGRALANVITIVDPDVIVLGGGVSNIGLFYTEGRARVAAEVFNDELLTPIVRAELGDAAGVLGAALLVVLSARRYGKFVASCWRPLSVCYAAVHPAGGSCMTHRLVATLALGVALSSSVMVMGCCKKGGSGGTTGQLETIPEAGLKFNAPGGWIKYPAPPWYRYKPADNAARLAFVTFDRPGESTARIGQIATQLDLTGLSWKSISPGPIGPNSLRTNVAGETTAGGCKIRSTNEDCYAWYATVDPGKSTQLLIVYAVVSSKSSIHKPNVEAAIKSLSRM